MAELKTTLDNLATLERILDGCSMQSHSPVTAAELCHDAKLAHELAAEVEWYKLLAWGLHAGRFQFHRSKPTMAMVSIGKTTNICQVSGVTRGSDGLPVRSAELEQALRTARKAEENERHA